jgi:serine/threonine-protein kinase
MVGRTVARYVLVERLGKGAAGRIYRAVHPVIGSVVAIKILYESVEESPDDYSRFVREAQAVNRIQHPNIVRIMDMDTLEDGRPYVVMEYLEGTTLRERMVRPPFLEPEEARRVVQKVLDALQAAHDAGFVHRDLKPENIFITKDDRVKLLDFGIAKMMHQPKQSRITQKGAVVGTPMYLAPEQAVDTGSEVGPAADIYSMGVTLYEMYTGKSPFKAKGMGEILLAQMKSAPIPPHSQNPDIAPGLEAAILHCLEKKPEDRPASAQELKVALDEAFDESDDWDADTLPRFRDSGRLGPDSRPGSATADSSPGTAAPDSWGSARGQPLQSPEVQRYLAGDMDSSLGVRKASKKRALWLGSAAVMAAGMLVVIAFLLGRGLYSGSKDSDRSSAKRTGSEDDPGETITVLQSRDIVTLDPTLAGDTESINLLAQTHEPLVVLDGGTGRIKPRLATSWTRVGDTYLFNIRKGVRFHDRTPMTAERVARSLRRTLTSRFGKAMFWDVREVKAAGTGQVAIRLSGPSASFLTRLSLCPAFISLRSGPHLVGTGPFVVHSWDAQAATIILKPNKGYWGGRPKAGRLVFKSVRNPKARARALAEGEAAVALDLPPRVAETLEQNENVRIHRAAAAATVYLMFNTHKPYLSNPRIRRALAWSVDVNGLLTRAYRGSATRAAGSFPPGLGGVQLKTSALPFAPQRTKAIVRGTELAARTLKLYVFAEPRVYLPEPNEAARALAQGFRAGGVKVQPVFVPLKSFNRICAAGDHDMALSGWIPDYPDPENVYQLMSNSGLHAQVNHAFFTDPKFEALLGRSRKEIAHKKRVRLLAQMEKLLRRKMPWVPLVHMASFVGVRSNLKGVPLKPGAFTGLSSLAKAHLGKP